MSSDYEAWREYMRSNRGYWTIDPIHNGENGRLLAFVPSDDDPERGVYVMINQNKVTSGRFKDACPHIGDAVFTVMWEREFESQDQAYKVVIERLGVPFLFSLIGLRVYRA